MTCGDMRSSGTSMRCSVKIVKASWSDASNTAVAWSISPIFDSADSSGSPFGRLMRNAVAKTAVHRPTMANTDRTE
jgi:hypothetical protein